MLSTPLLISLASVGLDFVEVIQLDATDYITSTGTKSSAVQASPITH